MLTKRLASPSEGLDLNYQRPISLLAVKALEKSWLLMMTGVIHMEVSDRFQRFFKSNEIVGNVDDINVTSCSFTSAREIFINLDKRAIFEGKPEGQKLVGKPKLLQGDKL